MYKGKKFLAVILARGGSKRLPGKNTHKLGGKHLITWSIEAGLSSKFVDDVIVSSDNSEILNIAKRSGSNILKRPHELALDTSTSFEAIEHVLKTMNDYDYVVLLQPTSPLRNAEHIDEAIKLLVKKNADSVVSVCETDHSPLWCNTLPINGSMSGFINKKIRNIRSQDLPVYYRLNGAIYIVKVKKLLEEKAVLIEENVFSYIMDVNASVDIDNKIDFLLAETIIASSL